MINATVLCKTPDEKEKIVKELKAIQGVQVDVCMLAIAIEYDAPDTATELEIEHNTARLLDIVEGVETHGIVIS